MLANGNSFTLANGSSYSTGDPEGTVLLPNLGIQLWRKPFRHQM